LLGYGDRNDVQEENEIRGKEGKEIKMERDRSMEELGDGDINLKKDEEGERMTVGWTNKRDGKETGERGR
jgi:hypothetical protein